MKQLSILLGFGLAMFAGCGSESNVDSAVASVSDGCQRDCATTCAGLRGAEKPACIKQCLGAECDNPGVPNSGDGFDCSADEVCNEFCAPGEDPDCAVCPCWTDEDLDQIYADDYAQVGEIPGPACAYGPSGGGTIFWYADTSEKIEGSTQFYSKLAALNTAGGYVGCSLCFDGGDVSSCTAMAISTDELSICELEVLAFAENRMGLECYQYTQ